jgi:eukaryotic-like serine/threonine-protein kinase
VAGQFYCTRCSTPLDAPTATGLCAACVLATRDEPPPAAPPAPETPQALADGTPAGAIPNPFAPTAAAADHAPTLSAPFVPEGDLPPSPDGFTLIRRIGGGGMGDVYLAHEGAPDRFVAVKFMRRPGNAQLLERFRLEFRALANLDHEHSVRVHTYKLEGAAPYYAMELLEGGSVADRLRANGPLAAADAVDLIRKVALAVQALHEYRSHGCLSGVIHRDIKPGNILLTKAGEPKLADFGLVKYLDAETITHTEQQVGTAQYMPPEQFNRANGAVSYPADVYGLGATLYHLLTGCPPFTGETMLEVCNAVLCAAPVRVRVLRPEVPLALEAVVMKCLAKDPAERYQTVAELLKALKEPEADSAPRYTRGHRLRLWLKRHARALALGAAGLVALVAVAVALWPEPDPRGAARAQVAQGEMAVLMGAKGVPKRIEWRLRPAALGASPYGDGACFFQSVSDSQLELLDDPGTDAYVLEADLQFHGASADGGFVALTFGHTGNLGGPQRHFAVPIADTAQGSRYASFVRVDDVSWKQQPNGEPLFTPTTFAYGGELPLLANRPAPWRTVRAEVTPSRVRVFWRATPEAEFECLTDLVRTDPVTFRMDVPKSPQPANRMVPPQWKPRLPLGVWVHHGAAAFKNVTVTPIR